MDDDLGDDGDEEPQEIAIVCFPDFETVPKLMFSLKAVMIFTSVGFLVLALYI